jgi:hypothetical protein
VASFSAGWRMRLNLAQALMWLFRTKLATASAEVAERASVYTGMTDSLRSGGRSTSKELTINASSA